MSEITMEQYEDAILMLTDRPEWHTIMQGLMQEIKATQGLALELESWEKVNEARGFCRGLAFVMSLRQQVLVNRQKDDNADV